MNPKLALLAALCLPATASAQANSSDAAFFGPLRDARAALLADGPALLPASGPTLRYEPQALRLLIDEVQDAVGHGVKPVVLFDIDDTLVNTAGRHLRILREFLAQEQIRSDFPAESALLAGRLELSLMRYEITDTARDAGIRDAGFLDRLSRFWLARFFDNDYLPEDPANPGAVDYVKEVVGRGAVAVYLTGRWEELRPGTEEMLRKNDFPAPDGRRVILAMKPDRRQKDDAYKDEKLPELARLGKVVGGFENEPKNVNIFKQRFPDGIMIFLDTKTSGQKDPASGRPIPVNPTIPWVADFATKQVK